MSDKEKVEESTMTELKNSTFTIQWIIVIFIMIIITTIINKSFGSTKENFFCIDLTNSKWISSSTVIGLFSLISFLIIFFTRQISKDKNITRLTKEENTETLEDTIPYIIISVAGYLYSLSYIKRKFQADTSIGGGAFGDTYNKLENIEYGTITLYMGMIVMFINVMSYMFLYLKNKENNRKYKYARSIYYGQISVMLIGALSFLFIMGFACGTLKSLSVLDIILTLIKLSLFVLVIYFSIKTINNNTDGEHWFGGTKEENEEKK